MKVRQASQADHHTLVSLYRTFFPVHNVFQQREEEVIDYLKDLSQHDTILVYDDDGIRGAIVISQVTLTPDGSHRLCRIKHLAYEDIKQGQALLDEAERRASEGVKSAKIEAHLAQGESAVSLFHDKSYTKQAELPDHYRMGERCYVYGKIIQ